MQRDKGHIHFFSLVVFILAVIGAVQVVHWYREHTLWQNTITTFQELDNQVRAVMERVGYLEDYDVSMRAFLESIHDNSKALAAMEQVIGIFVRALEQPRGQKLSSLPSGRMQHGGKQYVRESKKSVSF